jgi:hypothetical protein
MGNAGLFAYIQSKIAALGWRLFLWGSHLTEDAYRDQIYQQEALRELFSGKKD